jgi:ABC-type multidrug transport system ATPase subunit
LSKYTRKERNELVEKVILELGLKDAANTLIGDEFRRGCSGGEKRRTSIGVQLLANPSLIFLDEPTTGKMNCECFLKGGLDAYSALQLIRTLKDLAQSGRTVITTIHQPRSDMYDLSYYFG